MSETLALEPRPLSFNEIISVTWSIFTGHLRLLLLIAGVLAVPLSLLATALGLAAAPLLSQPVEEITAPEATAAIIAVVGIGAGVLLLSILTTVLSSGALIRAVGDVLAGVEPDFGRSYQVALNRFWRLLGVLVIQAPVVAGLFITVLGIPLAIFVVVRWLMAQQVVVLENTRSTRALGRSWEMVRGRWWRTLGIALALGLLSVIPSLVTDPVSRLLEWAAGDTILYVPFALLGALVAAAGQTVGTAFGLVGLTVLYYDLKAREAQRVGTA